MSLHKFLWLCVTFGTQWQQYSYIIAYNLPQVAFVAILVITKDLPLCLYTQVVQNANLYSHKKGSHVNSKRSFWQKYLVPS